MKTLPQLRTNAEWPEPGVYRGVPYTQYATLRACNATMLKALAVMPPEKAKYTVENRKVTTALREGIILHKFILEPAAFRRDHPIAEPCAATLSSGDRKGDKCGSDSAQLTEIGWRCGKHRNGITIRPGVDAITPDLLSRLSRAESELCRIAPETMDGVVNAFVDTELTLIWIDPGTEVLCKCRLDIYDHATHIIDDIKKVRSADAEHFGGVCGTLGYHIQDAWYRRGARATIEYAHYGFRFMAVEMNDGERNGAQILQLDGAAQDTGEKAAQSSLELYAECLHHNNWPGYTARPKLVSLRPWMIRAEDAMSS